MSHRDSPLSAPRRHDTEAIWSELLPLIASGASLPAALRQLPEPRPTLWWCKMAIRNDPDLDTRYRAAMELRADALADEIAAIADEPIPDHLRGADASAFVQRQRMRVDAKKWLACKLFPKRWGDRVELGVDIAQRISITAALAQAEQRVLCYENGGVLPADEGGRARIGVAVAASEGPI
jgi:hypothetical protein